MAMLRPPKVQQVKPRAVEAAEFERAIAAHEAFVGGRPDGVRAQLRLVVAQGVRCERRMLCDADFGGSDLTGASFMASDLSRAVFYCTNLQLADLRAANLSGADLRGARLAGAKLLGAILDHADLRSAVLSSADPFAGGAAALADARLDGVDLSAAVASGADFSNCSLKGAVLRHADLKHANLSNANLSGAQFDGVQLAGAQMRGAVLCGVDVSKLSLPPEVLQGCVTDPSPAAAARVAQIVAALDAMDAWVRSGGREGSPATFDNEDLRPVGDAFASRQLPGVSLRGVMAIDTNFRGTQFAGARFDGADLRGADFTGADLRGVSFRGANLAHACFDEADLGPLALVNGMQREVQLEGATLGGSGLAAIPPARSQPPTAAAGGA